MPGIELSGERRLLLLWLIISLILGCFYYTWPLSPFVTRFERAYYEVFWNRPIVETNLKGLQVGIIAPQYLSSLVDTEMWIWIRNDNGAQSAGEPTATASPTSEGIVIEPPPTAPPVDEEDRQSLDEPVVEADPTQPPTPEPTPTRLTAPIVVIGHTLAITPRPTATLNPRDAAADTATTPVTPVGSPGPMEAQIIINDDSPRDDIGTISRSAIQFPAIYPNETVGRLVWIRLLPRAYEANDYTLGNSIFLSEDDLEEGSSVRLHFDLWQNPDALVDGDLPLYVSTPTSTDAETDSPNSVPVNINTRMTLMRGFARTLLLPPWSNGVLLGLGLISAFMLNSVVSLFDQRRFERQEDEREHVRNLSHTGHYRPEPASDGDRWEMFMALALQGAFWAAAITAVVILVANLTETFVLCPMIPDGADAALRASCNEFWGYKYAITAALAAVFLYKLAYWRDKNRRPPSGGGSGGGCPIDVQPGLPLPGNSEEAITISGNGSATDSQTESPSSGNGSATDDQTEAPSSGNGSATDDQTESPSSGNGSATDDQTESPSSGNGSATGDPTETTTTSGSDSTAGDPAEAPPITIEIKKKISNLTPKVNKLAKEIENVPTAGPQDYVVLHAEFNGRYRTLKAAADALPPNEWAKKEANATLIRIGRSLDQWSFYNETSEKAEKLILAALVDGDNDAAKKLGTIWRTLGQLQFDHQPAKTLAEERIEELKDAQNEHERRFVTPHLGVINDVKMADALKLIGGFELDENMRFFQTDDIADHTLGQMTPAEALEIGRARLTAYRFARLQSIRDQVAATREQVAGKTLPIEEAIDTLRALRDEMSRWPMSLPGWQEFPEPSQPGPAGENSFENQYLEVKGNIGGQISVWEEKTAPAVPDSTDPSESKKDD